MFSIKNYTPQQLAALMAALIALPVSITFGLVLTNFWYGAIFFMLLFFTVFFIARYFINVFVQRKIKLIYKLIYQTKASKREETYYKYILPKKTIEQVNNEVENWASNYAEELSQRQKNEQYRKEFLQNLSHEFKTPIFAIQGYIEALLDGGIEDEKTTTKFLQNTARNVQRMVHLVNDLDEISKLETGEQPLNNQSFIIQDLVKEVFETLSIKINNNNIKATIKKGCEQPIIVFADKEKIRQVFNNLVENAIKYGRLNGFISISIYKTIEDLVLVEVSDDGIGIADEHLARIFERFYRTDIGRSRNVGGTGLGLAICKHIIEAHNQAIHVRSAIDIGTTIGFSLPQKK